jgi:long-chain fatty acid transport protein
MKKLNWRLASAFTLVGIMAATSGADAAGFGLRETTASYLGTALAGYGSAKEDVSAMFMNPATMATIKDSTVDAHATFIAPSIKFTQSEARVLAGGVAAPAFVNTTGGTGGDSGRSAVVPAIYAMWSARPDLKLGVNMTVPFGLKTEYDRNWAGRYRALRSEIRSMNINPSFAYTVPKHLTLGSGKLSVGAGVQIQYIQAKLSRMVDFAGLANLGIFNAVPAAGLPIPSQSLDVVSDVIGDDWSYGANLGFLYEFTQATRLGVFYRSSISHKLVGKVGTENRAAAIAVVNGISPLVAAGLNAGTPNTGDKASAPLQTPESVGASFTHEINKDWAVMGDLVWTHWSRLKNLRIDYARTGVNSSSEPLNWKDTVFASFGGTYKPHDDWKLKLGVAFDQGAADADRSPRLPDINRYWLSAGADWNPMHRLNLSLAYSFIFSKDAGIAMNADLANRGTNSLKGSFKSKVHLVGVRASYSF